MKNAVLVILMFSLISAPAFAQTEENRADVFERTSTRDCRSYYPYNDSTARRTECFLGNRRSNGDFEIHGFEMDGRTMGQGTFGEDLLTLVYCRPHGFRRGYYRINPSLLSEDQKEDSPGLFFLSIDKVDEKAQTILNLGYHEIYGLTCLK